jgi:hypothetical protein
LEEVPVAVTREDVLNMTPAERAALARLLTETTPPPPVPAIACRRRTAVLIVTTVGCVALIPWIGFLAATLSQHHRGGAWRASWVGFDIVLVVALGATAWFGWHRRHIVTIALAVTGTLLCADAWFDVLLSWGTRDQWSALATALLIELPVAALMFASCIGLERRTVRTVWRLEGNESPAPPLHAMPVVMLTLQRPNPVQS